MSKENAFIGSNTILGKYWTSRRSFDQLIHQDNIAECYGKSYQTMVLLDPATAYGQTHTKEIVEQDASAVQNIITTLADVRAQMTIFITTCDMLVENANEESPTLTRSEDPYIQSRIELYEFINQRFGCVLNVHISEIASADARFCPLISACIHEAGNTKGKKAFPFAAEQLHQLYFPERIMGDVERCLPLGIKSIIPAMPPLSTQEIVEAIAPKLVSRLKSAKDGEVLTNSNRKSLHSSHWLDPKDGYFVTKDDQLALLQFYFGDSSL